MAITDGRNGYGWLSIVLHWSGAALVVALFLIGEQLEELPRGPERTETLALHVSLGASAFLFLAGRVLWRLVQGEPTPPAQPRVFMLMSRLVQWALLAAIATLILSGPFIQWTAGRDVEVFGLFAIPGMLPRLETAHDVLEEVHEFASHALIPLVALHVLGALKHLVIDRDGTFWRILRPARRPSA
ncbi:MAG: cytochrome b [Inquilinus sp.]|nr:cytochrome b [Inquilinus sp.]